MKEKMTHWNSAQRAIVFVCCAFAGLIVFGVIVVVLNPDTPNPSTSSVFNPSPQDVDRYAHEKVARDFLAAWSRNPDSLKVDTVNVNEPEHSVCMEFRAQNGYGGFNRGLAIFTPEGKFYTEDLMTGTTDPGFSSNWRKYCNPRTVEKKKKK